MADDPLLIKIAVSTVGGEGCGYRECWKGC